MAPSAPGWVLGAGEMQKIWQAREQGELGS